MNTAPLATLPLATIKTHKNYQSFYQNSRNTKYTDFTLNVIGSHGKNEYHVHKVILANHSDFFQAAFDTNCLETQYSRMDLQYNDEKRIIPLIFEYMYKSELSINANNIIALISGAEYLQCVELVRLARKELSGILDGIKYADTLPIIIEIWKDAVKWCCIDISLSVQRAIAPHFEMLKENEDFSFLSFDAFKAFMTDASLMVEHEFKYYKIITTFVENKMRFSTIGTACIQQPNLGRISSLAPFTANKESQELSNENIFQLFETIEFEKFSVEQLDIASKCSYLPHSLLVRGLMNSLKFLNGIPVRTVDRPTRTRKAKKTQTFTYSGIDFDEYGIIYFLGTQGLIKPFINPHIDGYIKCEMSSCLIGEAMNITSRQQSPTCTRSQEEEWILLDFGGSITIQPTYYTLQHGSKQEKCFIRSWMFQGSKDKLVWDTISAHKNDDALNGSFGTASWPVECSEHYRYFRISVKNYFLQISGIEIYGDMKSD